MNRGHGFEREVGIEGHGRGSTDIFVNRYFYQAYMHSHIILFKMQEMEKCSFSMVHMNVYPVT